MIYNKDFLTDKIEWKQTNKRFDRQTDRQTEWRENREIKRKNYRQGDRGQTEKERETNCSQTETDRIMHGQNGKRIERKQNHRPGKNTLGQKEKKRDKLHIKGQEYKRTEKHKKH